MFLKKLWRYNLKNKMNFFRIAIRNFSSNKGKYLVEQLKHREIIRVSGEEIYPFLQGLITNDIHHLTRGSLSIFTMFLNKNGRVLYDSIIYKTPEPNTLLIECDKNTSRDMMRHLRTFRVRKKISVDHLDEDYTAWVLFNAEQNKPLYLPKESTNEIIATVDPRMKDLGCRLIVPKTYSLNNIKQLLPENAVLAYTTDGINDYNMLRYDLGIGEGVIDHPPTKCFPLESNCDYLHGISFQKGCYLGQELTARTHHTGIIRKRLMPFRIFKTLTEPAEQVQLTNGTSVGLIRSIKGKKGLALIRMEKALKAGEVKVNDEKAEIIKPTWWPQEMSEKVLAMSK